MISEDILFSGAFEMLCLDPEDLKAFKESLVGFSRERVQMKCYIMLKTTFGAREKAKGKA